ncbi:MAG: carbonic anhydrase [Gemmataceae bacterium]
MERWTKDMLESRTILSERPLADEEEASRPTGLLITCASNCFAPALLEKQLAPGRWYVHRTPGNILPPYGTGYQVEENLIAQAVASWQVRMIVVCGHCPCGVMKRLLDADTLADDIVLRNWLTHAEAVHRLWGPASAEVHQLRRAVECNVRLQLDHLRTYPMVAAALAQQRLQLLPWLHDAATGELFYPATSQEPFERRAVLHPDHNHGLRSELIPKRSSCPLPRVNDPRKLYLA